MVDFRFFRPIGARTLLQILEAIGEDGLLLPPEGAETVISNIEELSVACSGDLSLAAKKSYGKALSATRASAVFVSEELLELVPPGCVALCVGDPHLSFVQAMNFLFPEKGYMTALRPKDEGAGEPALEENVEVGANVVIGSGAQIGRGTQIGPNSVIGPNVTIGRDTRIGANVTLECAMIGDNVNISAGVRVGTEGFGWLDHGKSNTKIPQLGRVIIQSGVSVGANATIDRGALSDTVLGEGTKIDNLVQIGHNCHLGRNCLIAATTGLSGGTIVGDSVLMGGGVGTSGHLRIGANSVVHGRAAVTKDWPEKSMLAGAPAQDIRDFWRELAVVRRLAKGGKQ
ncbi:MAG TPA: UDP-3-O-(3-hydroxymyristoyl)glucosamine N-acyltransferase [Devosia sp.]|nr:UDP-3-O-(3-hydroxymyristoyl)glucosamine N-acyltransferase [Devosia sp.]